MRSRKKNRVLPEKLCASGTSAVFSVRESLRDTSENNQADSYTAERSNHADCGYVISEKEQMAVCLHFRSLQAVRYVLYGRGILLYGVNLPVFIRGDSIFLSEGAVKAGIIIESVFRTCIGDVRFIYDCTGYEFQPFFDDVLMNGYAEVLLEQMRNVIPGKIKGFTDVFQRE